MFKGKYIIQKSRILLDNKNEQLSVAEKDIGYNEILMFLSNWNLLCTYALLDDYNFDLNATSLSEKLNIYKSDAEELIERINSLGFVELSDDGRYRSVPIFFNNNQIEASDLVSVFHKISRVSNLNLKTSDIFAFNFEMLNKAIIQKYEGEISKIISKIVGESLLEDDKEVYAMNYLICRLTRSKGFNK